MLTAVSTQPPANHHAPFTCTNAGKYPPAQATQHDGARTIGHRSDTPRTVQGFKV